MSLSHCVFYIFLCMLRGPFIIRWSLCIVSDVNYFIVCFGFQLFQHAESFWVRRTCSGCGHNGDCYTGFPRCSFSFLPAIPSSRLRFLKERGVIDSMGGMFSLSELKHSGSSKNQGLYSIMVGLEGHGPESDVMLLSFFLGENTLGSFLGLVFSSLVGFFHGLNFSVHFSLSSTSVWLPVLVLTFTTKVQDLLEGCM